MTRREGPQAELLSALQLARQQLLVPRQSGQDLDTEGANREDRVELTPGTTVQPHAFSAAWIPRPPAKPAKTFGCLSRWPVTAGVVLSISVLITTVQVWSSLHKPARADNQYAASETKAAPVTPPVTEPVKRLAVPVEARPPVDEAVAGRTADARVAAPHVAAPEAAARHEPAHASRPRTKRPQRSTEPVTRKKSLPHKKTFLHKDSPDHKESIQYKVSLHHQEKAEKPTHKRHSVKARP